MFDKILDNIKKSSLLEKEKEAYIQYARNLHLKNSPIIFDINQLVMLFDLPNDNIKEFVLENTNQYTISKRDGSSREVWKPSYKLKTIQRWILKNILFNIKVSESAHGFVKNKSILTNAEVHQYNEPFWVYSTDIKDFFPSIKQNEVKKIFLEIGYTEKVSEALSSLTTINESLVQGFPTSPMISNIYCREIDEEFKKQANKLNISYSRYADDITFSGPQKNGYLKLIKNIKNIVLHNFRENNFLINEKKTRVRKNKHTKIVTGIVVSQYGVRIPQKYYRRLNKELYYCQRFGVNEHLKYHGLITISNFKGYLIGLARFIYMVDPDKGSEYIKKIQKLDWE
ncbi:reverse transcriptase family protein [Pontibacillus yanchengensis]|uniref:RNA-directed DNA polymerase n=1 Tax=Pontibacillus yanchengensis Y32 TaxID=1385514 RepID=A0A0A2TF72_9BACI|nr:reverse transcriptase family protein [Pontibacillus yanchengensis]KGP74487.1 DNA polymerase [Pontibacillus yanchengensis Y32]